MIKETLPPFSILIAPSYLHPFLRSSLLEGQNGCIGIKILSPTAYLASLSHKEPKDPLELCFLYKEKIKTMQAHMKTYRSIALTPSFLKECHSFMEKMKFYHILPKDLPTHTQAQSEIKEIISLLYPIESAQDQQNEVLAKLSDCRNVYLYDSFYTLKEQQIFEQLIKQGATIIAMDHPYQEKEFYHAINMRQECEAIAQYIITHDLDASDIVMTLCAPNYKPVVEQVFQRYGIPYTMLQQSKNSIISQRFASMLSYSLSNDSEDLFACMDAGLFAHEYLDEFREYMEIFDCDVHQAFTHLQTLHAFGHILDELEVEKLKDLEVRAEECRLALYPTLIKMMEENIPTLLTQLIDILHDSMKHSSLDDIQALNQIQELLSLCYPYLKTKEDLAFILPEIKEIAISKSVHEVQGVILADLKQIITSKCHHFILGATQKNYPAFPSESGIFDETYLQDTLLPDMEQRYQHYINQCQKQLSANSHLIVTFPLGSYEGKGNEAALEIEEYMNIDPTSLPLIENYEMIVQDFTISSDTAKALFVKDHHIKGSISAIERYIHCPYAYFLRYGLSLREPMQHGFDPSYMGTMAHYILETLVEELGKDYTKATMNRLEEIVDAEVEAIQEVFPNNADFMQIVKRRFLVSFTQTLKRLDDFESHNAMHPSLQEYEFHQEFPIENGISFALKGYIDRIDESGNFYCILDYKSSSKTLSEDKVFAALQLQLLTYSIVVKKQLQKDVLGAYYISLKNQNIPYIAGKMKRRPVGFQESDKEEYEETLLKAHRLNGWTLRKDIDMLDDNGSHITGVSMNKDGIVKARKYYNYETICSWFHDIYKMIGKRILSGNISCTPDTDACLYCSYHEICRFKGFYTERKPLIELDDTLYWEGGAHDADME